MGAPRMAAMATNGVSPKGVECRSVPVASKAQAVSPSAPRSWSAREGGVRARAGGGLRLWAGGPGAPPGSPDLQHPPSPVERLSSEAVLSRPSWEKQRPVVTVSQ